MRSVSNFESKVKTLRHTIRSKWSRNRITCVYGHGRLSSFLVWLVINQVSKLEAVFFYTTPNIILNRYKLSNWQAEPQRARCQQRFSGAPRICLALSCPLKGLERIDKHLPYGSFGRG